MKIKSLFLLVVLSTSCVSLSFSSDANAAEWLIEPDISARVEYNDNIFLTNRQHSSVSAIKITPTLNALVKEKNWEAELIARIRSNNYSDSALSSNDEFYDFIGSYNAERNIFSLNANYDLDSNLNSTSADFGIAGSLVNREIKRITPQYTRLLTERLYLILSYSYSDVKYIDAENTRFLPYRLQSASASLTYDLSEKDKLTGTLTAVDYVADNDTTTYTLLISRIGLNHEFSETLSADFEAGVSRQDTTNLQSRVILDPTGTPVLISQSIDSKNRGFVLNAGVTKELESSSIDARISRDNTTNSFGGLNQIDRLDLGYKHRLSSLWRYRVNARYEDVTSLSGNATFSDRQVIKFNTIVLYDFDRNWTASFSYRYIQRRFRSDTSDSRAPRSNTIFAAITYNFPTLSTF